MYCQPPLQSWGTFSLEKKGLIFLQRSTGRFLPWSQCLAWQRRPRGQASQMLRRQGSAESGGSRRIYQRGHAASLPAVRRHACARACGLGRPRGPGRVAAHGQRVRISGGPLRLGPLLLWVSAVRPRSIAPFVFAQGSGGRRKSENAAVLPRLLPLPLPVDGTGRHLREGHPPPPRPPVLRLSYPCLGRSSGFCSSQEIVIHRACFFAKCNYQRPCVYG